MDIVARAIWFGLGLVVAVLIAVFVAAVLADRSAGAEVAAHFTPAQIAMARMYSRQRYLVFAGRTLIELGVLALIAFGPAGRALVSLVSRATGGRYYLAVALYALVVMLAVRVASFGLDVWVGFFREKQFGLATWSLGAWLGTYLKSAGLSLAAGAALITGMYWLMRVARHGWWLAAGTGFALVIVVFSFLGPVLIDPLFHRFTPVRQAELVERVRVLASRAGMEVGEILSMDASKRTTRAGAYFTGLGRTKRIVLYDNLINDFSPDGIELVLAHEMAHWKYGHIAKGLVAGAAGGLGFLWLLSLVLGGMARGGRPILSSLHDVAGVPIVLLLLAMVTFAALPAENWLSRRFEAQADWTALVLTGKPAECVRLERDLATRNLLDADPHPFVEWFLFTHPAALKRIQMAERFEALMAR